MLHSVSCTGFAAGSYKIATCDVLFAMHSITRVAGRQQWDTNFLTASSKAGSDGKIKCLILDVVPKK